MIELIYFDFNFWRADILRLCLSLGNIPYKYKRLARRSWPKEKKKFPFGQLPVLAIDNKIYAHTHTLARYCAKKSSLYDDNERNVLVIDQVLDWANEITNLVAPSIRAAMREKNFEKSKKLRMEFVKNDLLTWFSYLENLLIKSSKNKKFFTDRFSIADITAWRVIYWFTSGHLDMVDKSFIDKLPALKKYYLGINNYDPFIRLKEFKEIISH